MECLYARESRGVRKDFPEKGGFQGTRNCIVGVSQDLLAEKGFNGTEMDEIARRAVWSNRSSDTIPTTRKRLCTPFHPAEVSSEESTEIEIKKA